MISQVFMLQETLEHLEHCVLFGQVKLFKSTCVRLSGGSQARRDTHFPTVRGEQPVHISEGRRVSPQYQQLNRLKTSCWASRSLPPQQLSVCSFCAPCYPALMPAVAVEVAAVVLVEVVVVDTAVGGVVSPTDPHPSRYLSRTEVQVQGRWLELQLQEQ
ncbi:uncharacterized protein [Nothobranchius furzeri]